jgi:hypothetical protein
MQKNELDERELLQESRILNEKPAQRHEGNEALESSIYY